MMDINIEAMEGIGLEIVNRTNSIKNFLDLKAWIILKKMKKVVSVNKMTRYLFMKKRKISNPMKSRKYLK